MNFDFRSTDFFASPHLRYTGLWLGIGIVMMLIILVFSLISLPQEVEDFMWSDKLMHGVAYAGLMGWFAQLYKNDLARLILLLGLIGFGVSIELLQGLTPTRQFEFLDMVANASGVLLAWSLSYTFFGTILERIESLCRPTGVRA